MHTDYVMSVRKGDVQIRCHVDPAAKPQGKAYRIRFRSFDQDHFYGLRVHSDYFIELTSCCRSGLDHCLLGLAAG